MRTGKSASICAILAAAILVVPAFPAFSEAGRDAGIVRQVTTFGDGSAEKTVVFSGPGKDISLYLNFPNGAKILSASLNISGQPYVEGGQDCPEDVTLDAGNDGVIEWAFNGTGYGRLGEQMLFSNGTNSSKIYKARFYQPGRDDVPRIRLPKEAAVTRAALKLEGSRGVGPDTISRVLQMQSWAQNWIVTQGTNVFIDEVNQQNLYDMIQFDISSIPSTTFVSNATFWWGRNGQGPFDEWGYSFNDQLGAHRLERYWTLPTPGLILESAAESYNAIVNNNTFYDWNVTKMMGSWLDGGHENYGLCIHRKAAPDNNKWDYSLAPYLTLQYGTPSDVSLAVRDTAGVLFSRSGPFDNSGATSDFSAVLNDYLSKHAVNFTDDYGNEFVDIPLSAVSASTGRVNLMDLDVAYRCCATVDANPKTGSLAAALDALLPQDLDGKSSNITLAIFSNHTGRLKVSDLRVTYRPPDHSANIDSRSPEDPVVVMSENETVEFRIKASDLYNYSLNVTWLVDGRVFLRDWYNMSWYADFESNGTHNVTVKVNNSLHDSEASWKVTVKNVNRKPVIDAFDPGETCEMDENSSTVFCVTAHDPDRDALSYAWQLDGNKIGAINASYEYRTDYLSAGRHEVAVTISDTRGLSTSLTWDVTVKDVNAAPAITNSTPAGAEVVMNENEVRKFTVTDLAIDGDSLDEMWTLDGNDTGVTGKSYSYRADYNSSGQHVVEVRVTDGELSVSVSWNITVVDMNRPPAAVIASPEPEKEFLTWDYILLDGTPSSDPDGDALNFTWYEGEKALGYGAILKVRLAKGPHMITLKANDGRKYGITITTVELTVRLIEFDAFLNHGNTRPAEGDKLKLSVQLHNQGDGSVDALQVAFRVDGKNVSSQAIQKVTPGADFALEFQWKAVLGEHNLEIYVANQSFSKTVKVVKKSAAQADYLWLLPAIGIALAAVAAAAGAMTLARRKKKAAAPPAVQLVAQPPPAPAAPPAYFPTVERMAAPPPPAAPPVTAHSPPPSAIAPAAAPAASAGDEEAKAIEAIKTTETMLLQAEKLGVDTAKARQTFTIAMNFLEMGKYSKVVQYCDMAQNYID